MRVEGSWEETAMMEYIAILVFLMAYQCVTASPTDDTSSALLENLFLDIERSLSEMDILIEEGYVEFDLNSLHQMRFGDIDTKLGIDASESGGPIYSVNRSFLNRYIRRFGVSGGEVAFQWRLHWEQASDRHLRLYTIGGADESRRIFLNNISELKRVWGNILLRNTLAYYRDQVYDVVNFEYWVTFSDMRFEFELYTGNDPRMSIINRHIQIKRYAWFAAVRTMLAKKWMLQRSTIAGVQPLVMAALIFPEIGNSQTYLVQLLPSFTILLDADGNIRWMTDLEMIFSRDSRNGRIARLSHGIYTQIQIFW
ncbi:MAG: hypothetical protein ACLFSB_15980 [Chitinispirillaceae bacterium]